jgi:predicted AAA+ superfamily ATPase
MLRTDVLDFATVGDVRAMKEVFDALRRSVGSSVSYSSIAGTVGISPVTVKRYLAIFEALYLVFKVRPHTHKIARAILKEPKVYFYDISLVPDGGARFENLVALSLLKVVKHRSDTQGALWQLGYLRTKEGKEIDFTLADSEHALQQIIEAKLSDATLSKQLRQFSEKYAVPGIQVVGHLRHDMQASESTRIVGAGNYLGNLEV